MRYKDHILRAMNTDVEHLNLEENMLMNRTRCLILISLLVGMFAQAQTSSIKGIVTDVKTIPVEYANVILYDAVGSNYLRFLMVVTGCTLPAWAMWVHIYVFIIFRSI